MPYLLCSTGSLLSGWRRRRDRAGLRVSRQQRKHRKCEQYQELEIQLQRSNIIIDNDSRDAHWLRRGQREERVVCAAASDFEGVTVDLRHLVDLAARVNSILLCRRVEVRAAEGLAGGRCQCARAQRVFEVAGVWCAVHLVLLLCREVDEG
jgi:hypothetical protein